MQHIRYTFYSLESRFILYMTWTFMCCDLGEKRKHSDVYLYLGTLVHDKDIIWMDLKLFGWLWWVFCSRAYKGTFQLTGIYIYLWKALVSEWCKVSMSLKLLACRTFLFAHPSLWEIWIKKVKYAVITHDLTFFCIFKKKNQENYHSQKSKSRKARLSLFCKL